MSADRKTVCMIGLGYIGLPTATVMARAGIQVHGVDVNPSVVATINEGRIHIVEPFLAEAVAQVVSAGRLRASTVPVPADVFMIAVPTPFKGDHEPDLSFVMQAGRSIAAHLRAGNLVILESTSPVGATEQLAALIGELRPDLRCSTSEQPADGPDAIYFAYCPERVLPGRILQELRDNDRVIGGLCARATELATQVYSMFVEGKCLATNARTAEMVKLTENSFRDVNIAFANELSILCHGLSIDVWELIRLANHHPRVNILSPGAGVGGHCIAVDPWFIVAASPDEARLIRTAREVNDHKPHWVAERVDEALALMGAARPRPTIAVLGLAFKADVDDLRESPAVEIALELARRDGVRVVAVEPYIDSLPTSLARAGIELLPLTDALASADVVALLVGHKPFHEGSSLIGKHPRVIDACGLLSR